MSDAGYDDDVAHARQHFEEGLISAGFVETDLGWSGAVQHSGGATAVLIQLQEQFPFRPPIVVPVEHDSVPWSWHRELSGALCLVAEDDRDSLWWTEPKPFLQHIGAWFERAYAGWPEDRPDLDLERYFYPSEDTRLHLYDVTSLSGPFVVFRQAKNNTMRSGRGMAALSPSKRGKHRQGYVVDIGAVDVPPRRWSDISARIDSKFNLDRAIRRGEINLVLVSYRRGDHAGIVVLDVWPAADGDIAVRRHRSAADTKEARLARAGQLAPELRECRVAVVGLGALGSFIVDMLARSGVQIFTLVDCDVIVPGNVVRHLVGPEAVGLLKVEAVKRHVVGRGNVQASDIAITAEALTSCDAAAELLQTHDLVVNATADFATTALLHVTAKSLDRQILSSALQNDGMTYRIDVLPPTGGAEHLPRSDIDTVAEKSQMFDPGCGSKLSPTPPHAVIEAAAATVRHAIGLLVKIPLDPAGEIHHLSGPFARAEQ